MILEFFIVPIVGCALFLTAVWRGLSALVSAHGWPSWISIAAMVSAIGTLIVVALVRGLLCELRTRRERTELSAMEQRFPGCHVLRLSNGKWFLTDRSTGREHQQDGGAHHTFTPGKTRDGSSAWLQQASDDLSASTDNRSSR